MSRSFDLTGWLIKDKGVYYFATSRGWYRLTDVPRGQGTERPARVEGELTDALTVKVSRITVGSPSKTDPARRPHCIVSGRTEFSLAAKLRLVAQQWLTDQNYVHITLPQAWFRTEEYGGEEYRLEHSKLVNCDIHLLQSPELPLYYALVEGFEPCWTFAGCFYHEDDHAFVKRASYLGEFEQLVVGRAFSSLGDMMKVAEDLVIHLATEVSVAVRHDDFRRIDSCTPRGSGAPRINDLMLCSIPESWPPRARRVVMERLLLAGAKIFRFDTDGPVSLADEDLVSLIEQRQELRLGIQGSSDDTTSIHKILDVVAAMVGASADVARLVALQWNPTWSLHPKLHWDQSELPSSSLPVRSFTSKRSQTSEGVELIRDAELYLGGIEVAHVREYAPVQDLLQQAEAAGSNAELAYLKGSVHVDPPGMVGLFVGWERLVAVVLGLSGADRALLFPRYGDGSLEVPGFSTK